MSGVDPRLTAALRAQLAARPRAARVGWKLGVGEAERLGDTVAVGHLTVASLLQDGGTYENGGAELSADAELAVVVGVGYAGSLELVDLSDSRGGAEAVVRRNIFHRAVAFGEVTQQVPRELRARLLVDGVVRAAGDVPNIEERMSEAADVLSTVGERLENGDRVITGSVVQVPVAAGREVTADFGLLGSVSLHVV